MGWWIRRCHELCIAFYPVYKSDGTYFTGGANPVRRLNETSLRNTDNRFLGGAALDYTIIKNLSLRLSGSYEHLRGVEMALKQLIGLAAPLVLVWLGAV
jgi:hypothetical protein